MPLVGCSSGSGNRSKKRSGGVGGSACGGGGVRRRGNCGGANKNSEKQFHGTTVVEMATWPRLGHQYSGQRGVLPF